MICSKADVGDQPEGGSVVVHDEYEVEDRDKSWLTGEGLGQVWLGNPDALLMNCSLLSCGSELPASDADKNIRTFQVSTFTSFTNIRLLKNYY